MKTLVDAERRIEALSLFAYLRARLPEGEAILAEQALWVFEAIGSDPETRGRGFAALSGVESELAGNAEARAKWLVELGDIASMVGGRPNRAETLYQEAVDAGGSRATAALAVARLAVLADAGGRRDEATSRWTDIAARSNAPAGLAEAAKVVIGKSQADTLTRWQAEHPAEMSGADVALYLGLRALREGRYEASATYFRRAREMTSGRRWPYHVLGRLGS
jgi:tetratricopeptide (TPR) repeat protein